MTAEDKAFGAGSTPFRPAIGFGRDIDVEGLDLCRLGQDVGDTAGEADALVRKE